MNRHPLFTLFTTRIDPRVKHAVELVCMDQGIPFQEFVEEALLRKLEDLSEQPQQRAHE